MAKGRTISFSFLTDLDKQVLEFCESIAQVIIDLLPTKEAKKIFKYSFGKVSKTTRDAGQGLGGGKLQRDALCTRGIQGNAPFSNRNLRWHPLVVAEEPIPFAKSIKRVEIEGEDEAQTFLFVIENQNNQEQFLPSERVFELPERFVVLPEHWFPHIEKLRYWKEPLWTQNSCLITAYEACDWQDAVETYAVLGISAAVNFFNVDFNLIYERIIEILQSQSVDSSVILPSPRFPNNKDNIINCPLCKVPASQYPAKLSERTREHRWKPAWASSKRGEGEDWSMQIMHIEPLTETEIRHNAQNVRFGHRWCNVSMTDHSVKETVDFMEYIVRAHNRL